MENDSNIKILHKHNLAMLSDQIHLRELVHFSCIGVLHLTRGMKRKEKKFTRNEMEDKHLNLATVRTWSMK